MSEQILQIPEDLLRQLLKKTTADKLSKLYCAIGKNPDRVIMEEDFLNFDHQVREIWPNSTGPTIFVLSLEKLK